MNFGRMKTATGPGAECAHVTVFWPMKSCCQMSPGDRSENNNKKLFSLYNDNNHFPSISALGLCELIDWLIVTISLRIDCFKNIFSRFILRQTLFKTSNYINAINLHNEWKYCFVYTFLNPPLSLWTLDLDTNLVTLTNLLSKYK